MVDKEKETGKKPFSDMERIYEQTFTDIQEGGVTKGKIISVSDKDVLVDVGYKSEGIIPLGEFQDPSQVKVGNEVEVYVESKEDENGTVILSKYKADHLVGWERISQNKNEGDLIEGKVIKKIKGGLIVDIGMDAFLPGSQVTFKGFVNFDKLLGNTYTFKIIKINPSRRNIVLSRRDVLADENEKARKEVFEGLETGQVKKGAVKNITNFGAFIDLGGIDGLLHITDMSWKRVKSPNDVLSIGDEVEVMVLNIDTGARRISLGLKQLQKDPWEGIEERYPVGSRVKGKVLNVAPYGAFVELEEGIEGLIHISEFSWTKKVEKPEEELSIGDEVEVMVLNIDTGARRISLGLKQLQKDPWEGIEERYPVGSRVKGKVRTLADYGAFVEIGDGTDGLIHVSDMSWTRRINHPSEILKKDDTIEAVVLSIDRENRKISLGIKQLRANPWDIVSERYKVGSIVEGKITKITNFGIFVKLEEDLEGLIHISEASVEERGRLEDLFRLGDQVKAKIVRIDSEQRKIALTLRGEGLTSAQ